MEGGGTEDSAATTTTSPSSPAVQSGVARASFFSAPPTVVRLDPWRMFHKDDKRDDDEDDAGEEAGARPANVDDEDGAAGGGGGVEVLQEEGPDTDVSESLEMDSRGEEGRGGGGSCEGSIEDLVDDDEEEECLARGERAMSVEGEERGAGEQQWEEEEELKEGMEEEAPGREGDENEEEEEADEEEMDEEEELDKTAVSLAMAQLLVDIDQTSVGGCSDNAAELDILLPSDNDEDVFEAGRTGPESERTGGERGRTPSEDTTESVLRSIREMADTTTTLTSGEDTLRQVLQDVADMPDLSDSEEQQQRGGDVGEPFKHLDERFVTERKKRRKPLRKKSAAGVKAAVGEATGEGGSDSDITISTPSESLSSSSSSLEDVIQYNQRFLAAGGDDDAEEDNAKPDRDMMRDYMTTMSLALDESYPSSEDGAEKGSSPLPRSLLPEDKPGSSPRDEMSHTLRAEEEEEEEGGRDADDTMDTNASSVYLTPEVSMEEEKGEEGGQRRVSQDEYKDAQTSPSVGTEEGASAGTGSVRDTPASQKSAPEAQKPASRGTKIAETKPKNVKDTTASGQTTKGARKLPEVPRPRVSLSQPQNSKKSAPAPRKVWPSSASNKPPSSARSAKSSSSAAHSNLPSSSSASDSSKPQAAASSTSESSGQRATSSAASSDPSRTSALRALPRPGVAKRVASGAASSSDRSGSTTAPGRGWGAASMKRTNERTSSAGVAGRGAGGAGAKGKTVIHVDRGSLWSDSSTEQQDSEFQKKKIPVDVSVCTSTTTSPPPSPSSHKPSDIEDIPFADESEADEKFHTPMTSVKGRAGPVAPPLQQAAEGGRNSHVRKRLLPSPPSARSASNPPSVPSAQQIHDIRRAEQARAKEVASSDRKWPKAAVEGEGGVWQKLHARSIR